MHLFEFWIWESWYYLSMTINKIEIVLIMVISLYFYLINMVKYSY